MEQFEQNNFMEQPSFLKAQKNFHEKGYLGVTAEDHKGIFSTPPDELIQNPGKTKADLMSDEEIREYIAQTKRNILEDENIERLHKFNEENKKHLDLTITYLKSIGRLPENFK